MDKNFIRILNLIEELGSKKKTLYRNIRIS